MFGDRVHARGERARGWRFGRSPNIDVASLPYRNRSKVSLPPERRVTHDLVRS